MSTYNDAYARKLCQFYGTEANSTFTVRCYLNQWPSVTTFTLMAVTVAVIAHMSKIVEMPYYR